MISAFSPSRFICTHHIQAPRSTFKPNNTHQFPHHRPTTTPLPALPDIPTPPPNNNTPISLLAFSLIVDDIVLPTGHTLMSQIGGGGPQTLMGWQLYNHNAMTCVALAAIVGPDLPHQCLHWLHTNDINTDGLIIHPHLPTPRAWQILEHDGRRHEIWRSVYDNPSYPATLLIPPININADEHHTPVAEMYHLAIHPEHPPFDVIEALRNRPPPISLEKGKRRRRRSVVSIETFTAADKAVGKDVLKRLLSLCDIFSPNEVEAASLIYGKDVATRLAASLSDEELIGPLIGGGEDGDDGDDVVVVVVRRGPRGAVAGWRNKYQSTNNNRGISICSVPSYPDTKVVNVTGCGNSFLGAFLACYMDSNNRGGEEEEEGLKEALCWGCAVGSIMAEEMSTPNGTDEELRREAAYRAGVLLLKEREKNVRE